MKGERVTDLVRISHTESVTIGSTDVLLEQLVPLTRHSPLPELKSLVTLFRPKRVVPNQLYPSLFGLDYACMPAIFGPCLQPGGAELIHEDIRTIELLKPDLWDNLILEIKDVQAEHISGTGAEELVRCQKRSQPEDVLEKADMVGDRSDDGVLGWLLTYLPSDLANQLRAHLLQVKARHARGVRDAQTQVEIWEESASQTADGESQDDSWLAAHFLPEVAHQPVLGLPSPILDEVHVSRTVSLSEETVVAESTVFFSIPDSEHDASAVIPPPHPVIDDSDPIFGPRFKCSAPARQSVVKEEDSQRRAPSATLSSTKRLRDPEPPDIPTKRRKVSSAFEEGTSTSAASVPVATPLQPSSSISQTQPRKFHKSSINTSSSPSVYISPKLKRKARHLGFKGEAEIQNLAAMREKLRAMISKRVGDEDKFDHVPDKPDMGSSSSHLKDGPRNAEGEPGRSLKKEMAEGIRGGRSTARLRCIGSQSQGL